MIILRFWYGFIFCILLIIKPVYAINDSVNHHEFPKDSTLTYLDDIELKADDHILWQIKSWKENEIAKQFDVEMNSNRTYEDFQFLLQILKSPKGIENKYLSQNLDEFFLFHLILNEDQSIKYNASLPTVNSLYFLPVAMKTDNKTTNMFEYWIDSVYQKTSTYTNSEGIEIVESTEASIHNNVFFEEKTKSTDSSTEFFSIRYDISTGLLLYYNYTYFETTEPFVSVHKEIEIKESTIQLPVNYMTYETSEIQFTEELIILSILVIMILGIITVKMSKR